MKKRILSLAVGIIAAGSLSLPLGITAYAKPAEALPSITPSLTYGDGLERAPDNPGPFPLRATPKDLEEFEISKDEQTSSTPEDSGEPETPVESETPGESEAPAEPETPSESETPSEPETPAEPETPGEPETPAESETPENPDAPADPAEPLDPEKPIDPEIPGNSDAAETPSITDETIAADIAAIRESLGIYIENQHPFFADDTEKQYFFDNLAAIRQALDILVYAIIPVSAAILAIYKLCIWFYCTFVKSALE